MIVAPQTHRQMLENQVMGIRSHSDPHVILSSECAKHGAAQTAGCGALQWDKAGRLRVSCVAPRSGAKGRAGFAAHRRDGVLKEVRGAASLGPPRAQRDGVCRRLALLHRRALGHLACNARSSCRRGCNPITIWLTAFSMLRDACGSIWRRPHIHAPPHTKLTNRNIQPSGASRSSTRQVWIRLGS